MIREPLRPCRSCARHVRATDAACPFCNAALDSALDSSPDPAPPGPALRLSRAALFAFGTGAAVLTPALTLNCSSDETTCCPPYGHVPFDAAEPVQDGALATPDAQVGSGDAGDGSLAADAGSDAEDARSDAVVDAASDAH